MQDSTWQRALRQANLTIINGITPTAVEAAVFVRCARHQRIEGLTSQRWQGLQNIKIYLVTASVNVDSHSENKSEMSGLAIIPPAALPDALKNCARTGAFVSFVEYEDRVLPDALPLLSDALTRFGDAAAIYQDYWQQTSKGPRAILNAEWDKLYWHQYNYISRACWFAAPAIMNLPVSKWCEEGHAVSERILRALSEQRAPIQHQAGLGFTLALPQPRPPVKTQLAQPVTPPLVQLIIPTRDNVALLKQCVDSITALTDYPNYQITVVNNQSSDTATLDYFTQLKKAGHTVLDYDAPFNYSAINNWAVAQTNSELVALINDDIEVISSDWLSRMVHYALKPETGCVGAKLLYADNRIQHAGVTLGIMGGAAHNYKYSRANDTGLAFKLSCDHAVSAVTAACLVVKRSTFVAVGGLDETSLTVAFNDVDFCLKVAAAGYQNVQCNTVTLYHHESQSRGEDINGEKAVRFAREREIMEQRWRWDDGADKHLPPLLNLMFEKRY